MNTIFMNFEKSILSDFYRLLLNLSNEINLQISDKYVALSNLGRYYTWKYIKMYTKMINLRNQIQREMIKLNYLMDHILYKIFKIILSILSIT